ncbi:hypothetical protein DSM112329_04502 [Paraconexibacter sp. AEG42_29]|uniref:Secreted protein n=1 Tax=Paraconexibacter sp. AEG42_29 TaxID=2997339 RepID=A0AAU7B136_9ACTN
MNARRLTSLLAVAAAGSALAGAPSPAAAAPKAKSCPSQKGTIVKDGAGRVFHRGTRLYACTTVYGHAPKSRYMGPWSSNTKVSFDGVNLAWTVRTTAAGKKTDRVWAGSADTGKRWMLGQKPNPGGADLAAREDTVARIVANDRGIAWVTKGGSVVGALQDPAEDKVAPIGSFATPPSVLQEKLVLVGSWPGATTQLASSLRLVETGGDGDECGGVNTYELTVRPEAAGEPVGVRWDGYWTSTNCD